MVLSFSYNVWLLQKFALNHYIIFSFFFCLDLSCSCGYTAFLHLYHQRFALFITDTLLYIQNVSSTIIVADDESLFMSVCHETEKKNISVCLSLSLLPSFLDSRKDLHGIRLQGVSLTMTHTHNSHPEVKTNVCMSFNNHLGVSWLKREVLVILHNASVIPPAGVKPPLFPQLFFHDVVSVPDSLQLRQPVKCVTHSAAIRRNSLRACICTVRQTR